VYVCPARPAKTQTQHNATQKVGRGLCDSNSQQVAQKTHERLQYVRGWACVVKLCEGKYREEGQFMCGRALRERQNIMKIYVW
jgi:hypothetical protein